MKKILKIVEKILEVFPIKRKGVGMRMNTKEEKSSGVQSCMVNRELSWIKFNERVLEEAERTDVPMCERLSFLSIFQSNLDEFFMVRVGSLMDQMALDQEIYDTKTGMTPEEQRDACLAEIRLLNERKRKVYHTLLQELEKAGIQLVNFNTISREDGKKLGAYFNEEILPLLSPSIIGKRQPFPFLRGKEIYAVAVLEKKSGKRRMGIIPCGSNVFPRLIQVCDGKYMLSEELILHYLPDVFEGYRVVSKSLIRITRSADIDADALYDEDIDYREFMQDIIKRRKRLEPVRMELSRHLDKETQRELCEAVGIENKAVFLLGEPLDLSFLFQLQDKLRSHTEYFYPKRIPQKNSTLQEGEPLLPQILKKDVLLSYPFDQMKPFIRMLREAAVDRDVISIKMTLYRVAKHSEIISALIEAAENGKEVLVLVELKARFDEENNIEWSRRLEAAGCNVIYGLPNYKVHSKLCLISRRVNHKPQYITQIGTGNYNEKTSRLYTDFSLMTGNQEIGQDAAKVFQALAKGEKVEDTKLLLVAPNCMKDRILAMIDQEIDRAKKGEKAYIGVKVNSFTEKRIMERLVLASQAGVKVDMIVRGICCLLPGVRQKTENIRIISIVGRYLEHSRIYIFGCEEREKIYISSADFMTRNILRRVEVATPVLDPDIKRQIRFMFDQMLQDNTQARKLNPDGSYERVETKNPVINSQELFFEKAYEQAEEFEQEEGA